MPVVYVDYPGPASLTQIYGTFNRAMLRLIPSLRTYAEPLTAAMVEFYTMSQVRASVPLAVRLCGKTELSQSISAGCRPAIPPPGPATAVRLMPALSSSVRVCRRISFMELSLYRAVSKRTRPGPSGTSVHVQFSCSVCHGCAAGLLSGAGPVMRPPAALHPLCPRQHFKSIY